MSLLAACQFETCYPTPRSDVGDLIGQITPPVGGGVDASSAIVFMVRMALAVGALAVLGYMLWGAFDWITSGGDKDKVSKAQQKITNAVIGIMVMVVSLILFGFITGNILGIIDTSHGGWIFKIPTIGR